MEIWILVILVGAWIYGDMDLNYISEGMDLWSYRY